MAKHNTEVAFQYIIMSLIVTSTILVNNGLACNEKMRKEPDSDIFSIVPQEISVCPEKGYKNKYSHEYDCYANGSENSPVTMHIADESNGTLLVTFQVEDQHFSGFDIHLYVSESIGNENHCNLNLDYDYYLHSTKFINPKWSNSNSSVDNNDANCEKNITVKFEFVYSSCYYVFIKHCDGTGAVSPTHIVSCPVMLKTNYKKDLLVDKIVVRGADCDHRNRFIKKLQLFEYVLDVNSSSMTINKSKEDFIICHRVGGRGNWTCNASLKSSFKCICDPPKLMIKESESESSNLVRYFDSISSGNYLKNLGPGNNRNEIIKTVCYFDNLTIDDYKHKLMYNDMRCRFSTVWTDGKYAPGALNVPHCNWNWGFDEDTCVDLIKNFTIELDEDKNNIPYYYFLIFIPSLFVVLYCCKGNRKKKPLPQKPIISYKIEHQKVVLIYPRDCELFMGAMIKFRKLLKTCYCEVFDLWDKGNSNEIYSTSAHEWINSKIAISDCAIVVMSSCAEALVERNFYYRDSDPFDEAFIFAQRSLNNLLRPSLSLFPVSLVNSRDSLQSRIQAFRTRFTKFNLTFYCLPLQLESFVWDVMRVDRHCNWELPSEFDEFRKAADRFIDFESNNPNYLGSILTDIR